MLLVLLESATGRVLQKMQLSDDADLSVFATAATEVLACSAEIFAKADQVYYDKALQAFVDIPAAPSDGYVWNASIRTWVADLSKTKRQRLKQLYANYLVRKELSISYDAKTLDTTFEAREQALFKAFEFAERARLSQPATAASRVWENEDGTFYTFDTDQQFRNWLGGFVITLSDRNAALRKALRQHVIAIRALTTVEEILAYDITQGWPT